MEKRDQIFGNPPKSDEESLHHGGSHRNYMETKIRKLDEQFEAKTTDNPNQSTLFQGISIYVNGLTKPSHAEFKEIMAVHGGRFQNYYSRSSVTHIICSNLPDAKVKQYARERQPTPVVQPEWIVACIEQGKVVPINAFVLYQLRDGLGQQSITAFAAPAPVTVAEAPPLPPPPAAAPPAEPPLPQQNTNNASVAPGPSNERSYDPQELAAAQAVAAQMRADCDVLKGRPRSSKEDPNFVESYYRASRLHFIGRWKARLEALMASSSASEAPSPAPPTLGGSRTVIHLDMDCFFASVAEAGHPEFCGKPLAVCHSNSTHGSGEISSANYEARRYGITASMFISRAKELCPHIIIVPYEFEKYETVSEQVYRILLKYTSAVQPISCDEAFMDVTGLGDPEILAAKMRTDIQKATGCTASAGIGPNMLLARIATKRAKPNGLFRLTTSEALPHLLELPVGELPGVGWSTERKLTELGIQSVRDVHQSTKQALQTALGSKAGALLWDFSHGRDARRVEPPKGRKSVGAECNWGVRMETDADPGKFLTTLAGEVAQRMRQAGVRGRTITLKVKRKKQGWKEPAKYLGMGACDSLSRSITLARFTDSAEELGREATGLLRALRVSFEDIRGLGLAVTRLDNDAVSAVARPNAPSPAKLLAPPASQILPEEIEGEEGADERQKGDGGLQGDYKEKGHNSGDDNSDAGWESGSDGDSKDGGGKELGGGHNQGASRPPSSGTKRKADTGVLSPNKHPTLMQMLQPFQRNNNESNGEEDEEGETPSKIEILARYEGLSLTQIDAAELAALPWHIQKELITTLPRTRSAVAAVGETRQHEREQFDDAGRTAAAAAGSEEAKYSENAPRPTSSEAAAPAAQIDTGYETSGSIQALPSFSQVDPTVMAALPLGLRRELEMAYGMRGPRQVPVRPPMKRAARSHAPKQTAPSAKLRRIDEFVTGGNAAAAQKQQHKQPLGSRDTHNVVTFSQIDPSVLEELPPELRSEIMQQLRPLAHSTAAVRRANKNASATAAADRERQDLHALHQAQVNGSSDDEENYADLSLDNLSPPLQNLVHGVASAPTLAEALDLLENALADDQVSEVLGSPLSLTNTEDGEVDVPATQPLEGEGAVIEQEEEAVKEAGAAVLSAVRAALLRLSRPVISSDLEGARKHLRRVQSLSVRYSCFAETGHWVLEKAQKRLTRRYGFPVRLT